MKRSRVLLFSLLALLAAAAALPYKGRCTLPTSPRSVVSAHDPHLTPAALRWRQGQHAHWRACMLQH